MKRGDKFRAFCEIMEQWFLANRRHLPWRDLPDTNDALRAYKILVSEVMLQQTQVPRVIPAFRSFLKCFPTVEVLARASNKEVLLAWRGMGYNGRALRLRDAARVMVSGDEPYTRLKFPKSMEELLKIPGIGPYTAAAIRNFAFHIPTPCIDTNIRRVLHRTFYGPENPDGSWRVGDDVLLKLAAKLLNTALHLQISNFKFQESSKVPKEKKYWNLESGVWNFRFTTADWHAALMDYGSLVQTKRNPKWDICPLTAARLMKATPKNFPNSPVRTAGPGGQSPIPKSEPGRVMAGRFVPDRIFRGRIVESLRDAATGLGLPEIGRHVCIDWSKEHEQWLQKLIEKLLQEKFIMKKRLKYFLHQ